MPAGSHSRQRHEVSHHTHQASGVDIHANPLSSCAKYRRRTISPAPQPVFTTMAEVSRSCSPSRTRGPVSLTHGSAFIALSPTAPASLSPLRHAYQHAQSTVRLWRPVPSEASVVRPAVLIGPRGERSRVRLPQLREFCSDRKSRRKLQWSRAIRVACGLRMNPAETSVARSGCASRASRRTAMVYVSAQNCLAPALSARRHALRLRQRFARAHWSPPSVFSTSSE